VGGHFRPLLYNNVELEFIYEDSSCNSDYEYVEKFIDEDDDVDGEDDEGSDAEFESQSKVLCHEEEQIIIISIVFFGMSFIFKWKFEMLLSLKKLGC